MTKGQDLSVEEILNSIRGVIKNHNTPSSDKKELHDDILELTEMHDPENCDEILSKKVAEEVTEELRGFAENTNRPNFQTPKSNSGKTLEELAAQILKHEISNWLNANLSEIVRQVVEKEIRRLAPRE